MTLAIIAGALASLLLAFVFAACIVAADADASPVMNEVPGRSDREIEIVHGRDG